MKKIYTAPFFFSILLFFFSTVNAQDECRDPTLQEKIAVEKISKAIKEQIVPVFEQNGWIVQTSEELIIKIGNNPLPARPILVCTAPYYQLKISINPSSKLAQELQDSSEHYQKITGTATDDKTLIDATKKMFHFVAMQKMEISVEVNTPYLHEDIMQNSYKPINISGVPYAYQLTRAAYEMEPAIERIFLCFGNWNDAFKYATSHQYIKYSFAHPKSSPFIENAVIKIEGSSQIVIDILKKIEWSKMNDALTK